MSEDEWKTVTKFSKRGRQSLKKKNKTQKKWQTNGAIAAEKSHMSKDDALQVLSQCRLELQSTMFFEKLRQSIRRQQPPTSMVCYGIGNFGTKQSTPSSPMWQLSCALQLQEAWSEMGCKVPMFFFEPFMTSDEEEALIDLGVHIIKENEKGKRLAKERTLFFMPHCPLGLYTNLLFANLKTLPNVEIFGNSLTAYAHRLQQSCHTELLQQLLEFLEEKPLEIPKVDVATASGQFEQAFNDQALTTFDEMSSKEVKLPDRLYNELLKDHDEWSGEVV